MPSRPREVVAVEPAVLVVGGGIAGIQAALDVAEQGVHVYLVERYPSIGGHMAMLDKTFPTLDCSICILAPKMVDVARHPNITLLTYSEVTGVKRAGKGFEVKVLKKARYVDPERCTGCGICSEKCPVEVPDEFNQGLGPRKAIYIPFPQAVPKVALIDMEHCLRCGLCKSICEAKAIDFSQKDEELTLQVGAIIVAAGFKLVDVEGLREYGYGRYANVITALQLERLINASGPTRGELMRPSDGKMPKRVAFIQCVGSRDRRIGNPYCSRVCCMYAAKNAVLLKEHWPEVEVVVYYIDLRAYGKGFEEFVERAREEFGVKFVRGRVARVEEDPETGDLRLAVEDTETGRISMEEHDLVVLSVGLAPADGSEALAKLLGLKMDEYGFFASSEPKANPVAALDGIFICGCAAGPKDIPDSVAEASAAAMEAVNYLREVDLL